MKKLAEKLQVFEIDGEGLSALLGKRVILLCSCYFYEGVLEWVNDSFVRLSEAKIVYETGSWSNKAWSDAQLTNINPMYVMTSHIESFGESK